MWSLIISVGASLLLYSKVCALMCDDIDRQACQLIFNKKSDMCNDTHMASVTCPRFCNECALECYHCDHAVRNYDDCNSTRACNDGEVCMLKELQSSTDGHHEYIMNCETKQHCDGVDIAFPFGKRDINVRNVNAKCCDTDLCNYPAPTPISVTGTAPYAVKTTAGPCYDRISSCDAYGQSACVEPYLSWAQQNCERTCNLCSTAPYAVKTTAGPCYDRISSCDAYGQSACVEPYLSWAQQNCERTCNLCNLGCIRDVIFIIDESNSQMSSRTEILDFLVDVIGDMIIGDHRTRIALATYASYALKQFDLNEYHNKYDIQAALKTINFIGGISNIHTGLDFAMSHATSAFAGDRAKVPTIVVLITDKLTQSSVGNTNGASLLLYSKVCALMCDDIDRQACQLIFSKKSDMCNDTNMASVTCPRFCNECALECYHCDHAVRNYDDCNSTQACNDGEVCMLKELQSSTDGHHEYIMNCETKQHCDGVDIAFPFGKRDIKVRNVNAKCCDTDLCNYPAPTPLSVAGTTPSAVNTTAGPCNDRITNCDSYGHSACIEPYLSWAQQNCQRTCNLCDVGCKRDLIFIVDDSDGQMSSQAAILNFLGDVVGDMIVGDQGTRIALVTYASFARKQFDLNRYNNKYDIQLALKTVQFHGGSSNTHAGLDFALSHAATALAGDRANVPDTVVLITYELSPSSVGNTYDLSNLRNVHKLIVVGIGSNAQTYAFKDAARQVGNLISSSPASVIHVGSPSYLSSHKSQLNREICT